MRAIRWGPDSCAFNFSPTGKVIAETDLNNVTASNRAVRLDFQFIECLYIYLLILFFRALTLVECLRHILLFLKVVFYSL